MIMNELDKEEILKEFDSWIERIEYKTHELTLNHTGTNPAMYVFSLKKVILGVSSWWQRIKKPEDLKQITEEDINSVWYVQALNNIIKELKEGQNERTR
jgi:hypothetical protein